jgi:hypothetical protein
MSINLLSRAQAAVRSKHAGKGFWAEIAPTVDFLITEGWSPRRIWNWLIEQGYDLAPDKFRNFQVSTGRRKRRLLNNTPTE